MIEITCNENSSLRRTESNNNYESKLNERKPWSLVTIDIVDLVDHWHKKNAVNYSNIRFGN